MVFSAQDIGKAVIFFKQRRFYHFHCSLYVVDQMHCKKKKRCFAASVLKDVEPNNVGGISTLEMEIKDNLLIMTVYNIL